MERLNIIKELNEESAPKCHSSCCGGVEVVVVGWLYVGNSRADSERTFCKASRFPPGNDAIVEALCIAVSLGLPAKPVLATTGSFHWASCPLQNKAPIVALVYGWQDLGGF